MSSADASALAIAEGRPEDLDGCVALWLEALAARDGLEPAPETAGRCRGKFDLPRVSFDVLRAATGQVRGFSLVTGAGTGRESDPAEAAYLSLLAVDPGVQGAGWGSRLLASATGAAREAGYPSIVLHSLTDNAAAMHLYESRGWTPVGEAFEHPLWKRPTATLVFRL
jgi:ribosomal protein S18 acetylase RimI-like enzyme